MSERQAVATGLEHEGRWRDILSGRLGIYTLLLNLGMMLFAVNQFVVTTILPTVVADFGGVRYYAWTFSLFSLGAIIGAASAGPMRQAVGDRSAFVGAAGVLGAGLVGAALANDMLGLVGWRLVQGIGGGALASQTYGLVAVTYPEHLRGRVLALVSTTWGVATLLGPGFGGVFAELGSWRGAFWGLVPLAVLAAVLAWRTVPAFEGRGKVSSVPFLRLGLLASSVLFVSATSQVDALWARSLLIAASIAIAVSAFRRDARAETSMFPRQVTAIRTELGAAYWILLLFSVLITFVNIYSPLYLQVLHKVTPLVAGYLAAILSTSWTLSAVVVATWRGTAETASIVGGLVLIVVGATGLAFTVVSGPVWVIASFMAVVGFGVGFMNNPVIQHAIRAAPDADRHIAGTAVQTIRTLGISFGAAAAGMIAAAAGLVTDDVPGATVAHVMRWVYGTNVVIAALTLIAVVPLLAGGRQRSKARP